MKLLDVENNYSKTAINARRNISLVSVIEKSLEMADKHHQFSVERRRAIEVTVKFLRFGGTKAAFGRAEGLTPNVVTNRLTKGSRLLWDAYRVMGGERSGIDFDTIMNQQLPKS